MPRYWGHIHSIEKNLKHDLHALAKPLAEKNRKDEMKLVIASTTMNPNDETKLNQIQSKIATVKRLLFGFYN